MASFQKTPKSTLSSNGHKPTRKRSSRKRSSMASKDVAFLGNTSSLSLSSFSKQGRRPYQEDRTQIIIDLAQTSAIDTVRALQSQIGQWNKISLFTVADGHAGSRAAEYIMTNLSSTFWKTTKEVLQQNNSNRLRAKCTAGDISTDAVSSQFGEMKIKSTDNDDNNNNNNNNNNNVTINRDNIISAILQKTLKTLDINWLDRVKNSRVNDGSCVLVSLFIDDRYYFAHLGDCRAVLVRGLSAKSITKDHTPGVDKLETLRIEKAGGKVAKRGSIMRVIAGGTKIAVTRAIGDANMKRLRSAEDTPVLSNDADINIVSAEALGPLKEWCIVLCSDGVTSRMTNKAIAKCIRMGKDEKQEQLAQLLVERAYANGSFDNISAIVIRPL